jgi:undecaprenyl-diphosphatase
VTRLLYATVSDSGAAMRPIVERLSILDQVWLARISRQAAPAWMVRWLRVATLAGGATVTTWVPLLLLSWSSSRSFGLALLLANATSHACVQLLKRTVVRRRPHLSCDGMLALGVIPDAFSFPSGHSAAAMALAVPCLVCGGAAGVPVLLLALVVGASRVCLRVHYPSDVVAGQILGVAGGVLAVWIVY